jgi:hypothetical protein
MIRLAHSLVIALVVILSGLVLSVAAQSPNGPTNVHAYTYDTAHNDARSTYSKPERGPPATTYDRGATRAVAGHVSDGHQVRPETLIAYGYTTYDAPMSLAQRSNTAGTTQGQFEATDGDRSAVRPRRVAANAGAGA